MRRIEPGFTPDAPALVVLAGPALLACISLDGMRLPLVHVTQGSKRSA